MPRKRRQLYHRQQGKAENAKDDNFTTKWVNAKDDNFTTGVTL